MSFQPTVDLQSYWLFPFNFRSIQNTSSSPELIDDLLNTKRKNEELQK